MSRFTWMVILGGVVAAGCKTDISQQLLERELRMQEDQIYLLQDEIQEKCARLDHVAAENRSLKKQLGIGDSPTPARRGDAPAGLQLPGRAPRSVSPPASDGLRFGTPDAIPAPATPPATILPPTLEGVPPLTAEPGGSRGAASPADVKRLSHEESLSAEGRISHLVINPSRSSGFDGDGDGASDGLAIVFEPRDADDRLVTAGGDVSIVACDPAAPGGPEGAPLATWDVPAAESLAHFRRTSRARGLHFTLPWQGRRPAGDHVRVFVKLTTFDGQSFEADATVPTR